MDVLADVEQAALNAGARPVLGDGGGEGSVAVNDGVVGCGEAFDERGPGRSFLPVAELPVDDVCAGGGDEDAPPVEVGAVEEELGVDLSCGRWWCGFDVPAPLGASVSGPAGGGLAVLLQRSGSQHTLGSIGSTPLMLSPGS